MKLCIPCLFLILSLFACQAGQEQEADFKPEDLISDNFLNEAPAQALDQQQAQQASAILIKNSKPTELRKEKQSAEVPEAASRRSSQEEKKAASQLLNMAAPKILRMVYGDAYKKMHTEILHEELRGEQYHLEFKLTWADSWISSFWVRGEMQVGLDGRRANIRITQKSPEAEALELTYSASKESIAVERL